MVRPLHPGSGRPPARRRCFVCGIAPGNGAGIFVGAVTLSRGSYVKPVAGGKSRFMRAASVSVGLCVACLDDAMRDGRIYSSSNLRATMRSAPSS
jgi:hypothetical protein